jgi:hypothetical protein
MKKLFLPLLLALACSAYGQRGIKMISGSIDELKGETTLNFEFVYEQVRIGKFADEKDYIDKKKDEYNKKEPGRGDKWEQDWKSDRPNKLEPKFIEGYGEFGVTAKADSKYTLIFNTTFIEPGYNVYVSRKNASLNGIATLVLTSDKSKEIAKITADNIINYGNAVWGYDFDTGARLEGVYKSAGSSIAKFISKKLGK